jgi:hypothetical protein
MILNKEEFIGLNGHMALLGSEIRETKIYWSCG